MVIEVYVGSWNFLILLKEKTVMYKLMSGCVFVIIICLFLVGSLSFAQGSKSRPPGWDKGEKRGWGSDVPPGLEKIKQEHKDKWDSLTDEERVAKKEAWKDAWEEKMQEHKDKWDSLTDEERAAKKEAWKGAWEEKMQEHKDKWGSLTDEERAAKKEAWKGAWEEKMQEHKDKWDSLTDEKKAAKKGEQKARMAEWKAERDSKRAEWAAKREAEREARKLEKVEAEQE